MNLKPWNIISHNEVISHHTMMKMMTIFIEKDDEYFYLYDESFKIDDISRMPDYIRLDWINYNKKDVDIKVLDKEIREFEEAGLRETLEIANELKAIRRNLILKKII